MLYSVDVSNHVNSLFSSFLKGILPAFKKTKLRLAPLDRMHTVPLRVSRAGCPHSQVSQAALPLLHFQLHPPRLRVCTSPPQLSRVAAGGEGYSGAS